MASYPLEIINRNQSVVYNMLRFCCCCCGIRCWHFIVESHKQRARVIILCSICTTVACISAICRPTSCKAAASHRPGFSTTAHTTDYFDPAAITIRNVVSAATAVTHWYPTAIWPADPATITAFVWWSSLQPNKDERCCWSVEAATTFYFCSIKYNPSSVPKHTFIHCARISSNRCSNYYRRPTISRCCNNICIQLFVFSISEFQLWSTDGSVHPRSGQ